MTAQPVPGPAPRALAGVAQSLRGAAADGPVRRARTGAVLALMALPLIVLGARAVTDLPAAALGHLARTVLPLHVTYSLAVAASATALAVALAAASPSCALLRFKGRAALSGLLLVPLLIPGWFLAVVWRAAWGAEGAWAMVLALGVGGAPIVHLLVTATLRSLPGHYTDVLRVSGRGGPLARQRVLVPLSLPAWAAAGALVFLVAWSDLATARLMAVPTLTVGLANHMYGRQDYAAGAALGLLLVAVSLVAAAVLWRQLGRLRWSDNPGTVGPSRARIPVPAGGALVPWLLGAPLVVLGVVLPGAAIALWVSRRIHRVDLAVLTGDLLRTLALVAGALAVAVLVALLLLHTRASTRSPRLSSVATAVALALFALPAPVLGLSFIWLLPTATSDGVVGAVNETPLPLVMSLGVRHVAVLLVAGQIALQRQARSHAELLRVVGRTSLSTFLRAVRPMMDRHLVAGAAFVLLVVLKDLALTLLLQPFGYTTLSTRLFRYAQTGRTQDAAVIVLVMVLVGLYPLYLLGRATDAGEGPAPGAAHAVSVGS